MKLEIKKGSENYCCTVVEINNLHVIEGADFIQRTVIYGNNVIIGKDIKKGDKMLYFNSGTKLNPEFCKVNNLYSNTEYNIDPTAKKGYLSYKQHRVKAIKIKDVISDGFLLPLTSIEKIINVNLADFKVGDTFTGIDNINICEKYIVTSPRNSNPGGHKPAVNKFNRIVDNQFYLHNDTGNLRRNIHKINPDDIIGIHYKKHGTSVVFANIPTRRPLKWYEKLLQKLGIKIDNIVYDIIYSSRSVIKNKHINPKTNEGFYSKDIWGIVAKEIGHLIPKNWTLYGEILGYLPSGGFIQKGYDYSCKVSEHKFYVYKISVVNSDGKVIYLTDKQIEEYCEKVGLLYKDTFIYYGKAKNLYDLEGRGDDSFSLNLWRNQFMNYLETKHNEKDCYMCVNKVPEEGIVLRVEKLESYEAYKLKSKRFLLMESEAQEKEEINTMTIWFNKELSIENLGQPGKDAWAEFGDNISEERVLNLVTQVVRVGVHDHAGERSGFCRKTVVARRFCPAVFAVEIGIGQVL
jgi:hypothetical protein